MLSLTQLAINSLNDLDLRQVIDDYFELSEKIYQWIFYSEKYLHLEQFIAIHTDNTNVIVFTITELIDYIHEITQINDFLLERIGEQHIKSIYGLRHQKVLAHKRGFKEAIILLNGELKNSQINNQYDSPNVDCKYEPRQRNRSNEFTGQVNSNETLQFSQIDLETPNRPYVDDVINRNDNSSDVDPRYKPECGHRNNQELAKALPRTNNAAPPQPRPQPQCLGCSARYSRPQSKLMAGIVKQKKTYKQKFFSTRFQPLFPPSWTMNGLIKLFDRKYASTTFHSLTQERNWKKRKRKTKTLHFLYQMQFNDDQTWLPNI